MLLKQNHWDEEEDGDEDVVKDNYDLDNVDDEGKDKDNDRDKDGMIIIYECLTCVLIRTEVPRD